MDETLMAFNLLSNITIEQTDIKTVSILSTEHKRSNFTVILVCMVDRTKLPSAIIFKLKKIPRKEFPNATIRKKRTDLAVIPDDLTSHLQPLDVSLNRSFKSKIRNIYNNWMSEAIKNYISCGKIKRPFYSLVVRWIKEGWDAIDINMIRQSFKYCDERNENDSEESDSNYDKSESEENDENKIEDSDENESDDSIESESKDSNESETEENYYKENEKQIVIQDWK
uniref:DDE-1 domain-containing protein n=1 Tax=Rhizophagus irregularis (strain DAOM 181602 / DAOM 197198 / MUCL 43194) TaxID=747089 RepID=U9UBC4_RHIID